MAAKKKYNPYKKNPKLRAKKNAYQRKYNKKISAELRPELCRYQRKYNKKKHIKKASQERWTERRRRGIAGKGGKDLSHTKSGKMVLESRSKNRARNGQNGKSTKK